MQITKHVHALKIPFQIKVSPEIVIDRFVYAYLIYGREAYLIDSGVASSEKIIFDYLKKTGHAPSEISMLIHTHAHPDHIGASKAIKSISGCTVAIHQAEKSWLEDIDLQFKERPVPSFHSLVGGSVTVDHILKDGEELRLDDGLTLKAYHTPGHSNGSMSFLLTEENILFSGDAIPLYKSIPIYDDVLAAVHSVKQLKLFGDIKILLSSWDDVQSGNSVQQKMEDGLRYLQHIHEIVLKLAGEDNELDLEQLCKKAVAQLGLPKMAANPLVARSFAANLRAKHCRNLLDV